MPFILTFVAQQNNLTTEMLNIVGDFKGLTWLCDNKAADITVATQPGEAALSYIRGQMDPHKIDVFVTPANNRRKKLLLADMDSTIVTDETLDELAGALGLKDKIAAITNRAMNGEIDFHAAIRERVGLLKGLSTDALDETLTETQLSPGAKTFVATMKKHGARCILVSGGFTHFTGAIADQCGFESHHGNQLEIANNQLTGNVIEPIQDKTSKLNYLNEYAAQFGLSLDDALTIGDGANDLPMLQAAGLGLGYYARPNVAAQLTNVIRFNDLTAALYAQGYNNKDFA